MRATVLLACLSILLAACAAPAPPASPTPALLPLATGTPAAATAAPATAVIIASPTPSPTPVTHVVQKGETLGGIAYAYGVSLEALLAANPGVQAEFLSVGAVLLIPSPEGGLPIGVGALPAPTPVPIALGAPACYPAGGSTATGSLYCFVEARNLSAAPLENVSARVVVAGADGMPLASAVAHSPVDVIVPGGAAPLAVLFPALGGGVAATAAEVLAASLAPTPDAAGLSGRVIPLLVPAYARSGAGAEWTATGQVRNPAAVEAKTVRLTLSLYDQAGVIVGYRRETLPGGLGAGATREFSISAMALGGAVAYVALAAEGQP